MRDHDAKSGRTSTANADAVIAHLHACGLAVEWLLETHAHADHLSAPPYLQARVGGKIGIAARIVAVRRVVRALFNADDIAIDIAADGSPFERLVAATSTSRSARSKCARHALTEHPAEGGPTRRRPAWCAGDT